MRVGVSGLCGVLLTGLLGIGSGAARAGSVPLVDSLRTQLRRPDLADTTRVLVLKQLCAELNRADAVAAERYCRQALALAQRIAFRRGAVLARNSLAASFYYAGNFPAAQKTFAQNLTAAQQARMPKLVGHAYVGLGNVAAALGDVPRAVGYYQQARTAYAACTPRHLEGEALALNNIAGYLISIEHYREAARPLRQGLALTRQLGQVFMQTPALMNLGRLQRSEGHPDSALATWQVARRLARASADVLTEAQALLNESELELERNRADPALALARQAGGQQELAWALGYQAAALRQLGHLAAYDTLKRQQALQDTLAGRDQRQTVAQLQVRFDVERQQARILNLEQQRRIGRLRAERQEARTRTYGLVAASLLALVLMGGLLIGLLLRSRRRLQASESALRTANQTKDQLMRIIGHDLRGPVAGFQQLTPLLHEVVEQPDLADAHAIIRTLDAGAQQLGGLVDNLFQWTRARSNQVVNQPDQLPAPLVLASVVALYEPAAQLKGVQLAYAAPADLRLWADQSLLTTVLRNLVGNALKFTPAGGTVRLEAAPADGRVRVAVTDTGVGLAPDRLAALFDTDRVESTPGTNGEPGTGLGLPLSVRFVRLMGGELRVESTVGQGTRFWFSLPINRPA